MYIYMCVCVYTRVRVCISFLVAYNELKDTVCIAVISVWDLFFFYIKLNEQIYTTVDMKNLNSYGNNQVQ